jgi:DNA-binding winged helix-turn-helix (wHTH) protein
MGAQRDSHSVHFGVFELDPASGELRKHGIRIRLQDQPLKLLQCLLETPGEICPREELIRRIWPAGTFVDYERGLNVAITRLRQALGDSADSRQLAGRDTALSRRWSPRRYRTTLNEMGGLPANR